MRQLRRKMSAVLGDFCIELDRLERFDSENQRSFSNNRRRKLSKMQLYLLTESIFFASFREFEGFIRDVFLLYCLEKASVSGKRVKSYIRPKGFVHAEELIQSSMPFLDWNSPDTVIQRAELYLEDGFPIKLAFTSHLNELRDFKRIRNHIAHSSKESLDGYKKTLKNYFGVVPLNIPSPGEFLLVTEAKKPSKYKLLTFFELMRKISVDIT